MDNALRVFLAVYAGAVVFFILWLTWHLADGAAAAAYCESIGKAAIDIAGGHGCVDFVPVP